jgi:molybdate transport system regulatory protein
MEIKAKLYLVDTEGEKFMGIGVLWLLKEVDRQGSLRAAAVELGISYSKAYAMVRNLEKQTGIPVLVRRRGGAEHEGSSLTAFGKRFLVLYDTFQQEAKLQLEKPFADFSREFSALVSAYAQTDK